MEESKDSAAPETEKMLREEEGEAAGEGIATAQVVPKEIAQLHAG